MNTQDIISTYAAVIATIVFLWQLYEFYDRKKSKLMFRYETCIGEINQDYTELYLKVKIINTSSNKITIEKILTLLTDFDGGARATTVLKIPDFIEIEALGVFTIDIKYPDVANKFSPVFKNPHLLVICVDVKGKSYQSEYMNGPKYARYEIE